MNALKTLFLLILFSTLNMGDEPYVREKLRERIAQKYGSFAKNRFIYLQKTLDSLKSSDDLKKLKSINSFFNNVKYTSDMKLYKVSDYWATPYEFLGKDRGDCEDYVISKYFALKYLGVDEKKLFFTYVRSKRFKASHMVLTYFKTPRSEPLVLDNLNLRVFPASKRKDLIPVYNFSPSSADKLPKHSKKIKKKTKSHTKWDELKLNIKREKI